MMTSQFAYSDVVALVAFCAAAMLLTWFATGIVRAHAIRSAMFDVPNQRSSHTIPTPRGGGAAIVGTVLLCAALTWAVGWISPSVAIALLGGGALVAFVGWLDDRHHVSAGWRAIAHLCAAAWAVLWLGGIENVRLGHLGVISGPVASVFAVIAIAWLINLYNFMDGIDGIAAVEAILVGAAGAVVLVLGHAGGLALISASVAGAGAGFLIWNRMPARIFMGDVGSGFLGFAFATIALAAHKTAAISANVWVILLLVFIVDATATLLRRIFHGESWHVAHRLHAYQRLVQSGRSHAQVAAYVAILDLLLAALAIVVFVQPGLTWPALITGMVLVAAAYLTVERRLGMWAVTQHTDPKVLSGTSHTS
jgi:Fuc2NAc and GlcNAc transferase